VNSSNFGEFGEFSRPIEKLLCLSRSRVTTGVIDSRFVGTLTLLVTTFAL